MSVLKLKITSGRPQEDLDKLEQAGGPQDTAQAIQQLIQSMAAGNELAAGENQPPSIAISVQENEVRASGTFTLNTVIATDAVSINGVSFACVASGATGNQFNVGSDDTETAENLAAAINASSTALVSGYVTASSAAAVVTVTSAFYGTAGNMTTIASADTTIVASGARLTSGANDSTALTLNF